MSDAGVQAAPPRKPDTPEPMLAVIETLKDDLTPRLKPGLSIKRDNPDETPQQWSLKHEDGTLILSFGLIDRTFFWTWDSGTSNHYAKNPKLMRRVIVGELIRFGHIQAP